MFDKLHYEKQYLHCRFGMGSNQLFQVNHHGLDCQRTMRIGNVNISISNN